MSHPVREARLSAALDMTRSVARRMLSEADSQARAIRTSSGRVILDLSLDWSKHLSAAVEVVNEIHNQKPSQKREAEAVAAMRELAAAAAGLAAASTALLIETQVEIERADNHPIH